MQSHALVHVSSVMVLITFPTRLSVDLGLWLKSASISPNKNDKNGRWISLDGIDWYDLTYFGIDGTFMVRVCVEGGESVSELNSSLSIYPNPAKDQLFVETEMAVEEISVYDVFGRQQLAISGQQSAVDVSNLSNGVYFVKVKSENNEVVKRFIKK